MYESFYGLNGKPFQLNPDPSCYFGSRQHRRAMAYLEYGLHQNEGFIVVTGEVGAGKTTLVRQLLSRLDANVVIAAHLVSTQLEANDLLRLVAGSFGIHTKSGEKSDLLLAMEAFLISNLTSGRRCLLIVDEAQNLSPEAVEELRMLSNFQLKTTALLQSFLIGQPEFRNLLHGAHMQQLRQRVIAACHVGALDAEETRAYIEHRLKHVGWKGDPKFEPEAYQTVFEVSAGIPRRINAVCDRLLLCGFLGEKHEFRKADVLEVAEEFEEETQGAKSVAAAATAAGRDGALAEVEVLRQQLAPEAADDVHRIVSNISHDDVAGRLLNLEGSLLRLERNMLRLQNSTAASVTLLGQLIERLRTTAPRRESGSK
jgi:putative secretion ATPase (PEP-CTERM system associated)